jgi:cytochrome o ubiquinol oxidase subunit 2
MLKRLLRSVFLLPLLLLGGCSMVLLHPAGFVARQQSDVMIVTTLIIASIIIPVLIAIAIVAWRYRASNTQARYEPEWDHSPQIELLVWAWPMLIILSVGAISWIGTHQLDPYRPLTHVAHRQAVPADVQPLEVDVVSLPWKWLFFYPQYGIATVNELAAPVDRPITFKLTSSERMDSFFIPTLAGQIYTMPGMQTQLHAVINRPGSYKGLSANYSGAGFTDMRFRFYGMEQPAFEQWIAKVHDSGAMLDRAAYDHLKQPSRAEPVHYYAHFLPGLYTRILHDCVDPGQTCPAPMRASMTHVARR